MGRVQIAASEPVYVDKEAASLVAAVDLVQSRQARLVHISYYHASALATVLDLNPDVVADALRKLGCRFWPGNDEIEPLSLPAGPDELWTIALQTGPWLALLLYSSDPRWSKWLHHLSSTGADMEIVRQRSVSIVSESLKIQFDKATRCIEYSVSELARKGFSFPSVDHILQIAIKYDCVPRILLRAYASFIMPGLQRVDSLPLENVRQELSKPLSSGEALGYWGFSETFFVAQVDHWGTPYVTLKGGRYKLSEKRLKKIIPFLEQETGLRVDLLKEAFASRQPRLSDSTCNLSSEDLQLLSSCISRLSVDRGDRIRSGTGHSQEDIYSVRDDQLIRVPDVVVWPRSEAEIQAIISLAKNRKWCLIPIGGGTNVTQATRCPACDVEPRPIIAIDMKDMARVLSVDEENGVALVEAGITGRVLVEEMARRGYTIGHEPDSYEFSTLGGWIATKASGMKRSKYGNIEDIVKGVRVAGPDGLLVHGKADSPVWGRESVGLDLRSLMIGSEGCLGIITSAVIRIWPIPSAQDHASILLPDFDRGLGLVRDISRLGAHAPASVRLLDNSHFRLGRALQPEETILRSIQQSLGELWLRWQGSWDERQMVCITVLYEGSRESVKEQKRLLSRLVLRHGGLHLGASVGRRGYDMTFMIAYLRDFALTYHFLGESFESFVPWSKAKEVVDAAKERIRKEYADRCLPGRPFVGCRVTQLYHEGVCLYFYLSMNFENVKNASAVFAEIEHAARDEILQRGGSVSHHHGVGKLRSSFLNEMDSSPWKKAKLAIKCAMDPDNIFGARNGPFA
jgi:alkyldihydroxyacetonephosphate synthase